MAVGSLDIAVLVVLDDFCLFAEWGEDVGARTENSLADTLLDTDLLAATFLA